MTASTTVRLGPASDTFEAVVLPDVALVPAETLDREALSELSGGNRREGRKLRPPRS